MQFLVTHARAAAEHIFEGAAFLFIDELLPESKPAKGSNWNQIGVGLEYIGPTRGEVRLWVTESLARTIAVNMIGLDDADTCPRSKIIDAVKEVLNMIVGNFLTDAFDPDDVFNLGIPVELQAEQVSESYSDAAHLWLDVEGNPTLISLHDSGNE